MASEDAVPEAGQPGATPPAEADAEISPEQLEHAALVEATVRHPFGPGFFVTRLRAFARERCPDPALGLPAVEIHVTDGEVLDLCHIIGVTPNWVAVAVNDAEPAAAKPRMRTEFLRRKRSPGSPSDSPVWKRRTSASSTSVFRAC